MTHESTSARPDRVFFWMFVCALVFVAFVVALAHWPALAARAAAFDDGEYFYDNRLVQQPSWESTRRFFGEVLTPSTVRGYYHPLTMVSLMLDRAAGGRMDDPRRFHQTNLILHVANTILVALLLAELTGTSAIPVAVGLLFGLHPLTVETIPWIGERKTLLAAFFGLTALLCHVRWARTRRWRWYAAGLAALVLALLSKPSALPIPVMMLLLDAWPLGRLDRRALLEKTPHLALAAMFAVITYVSQARTHPIMLPGEYPWTEVPLRICHNLVFYLGKMAWPTNLTLVYPYPSPMSLGHLHVLLGVVGTALLAFLAWLGRKRAPYLWVGLAIFLVTLLPTMGPVRFSPSIAGDKYVYLPMMGVLLVVAAGVTGALRGLANRHVPRGVIRVCGLIVLMTVFLLEIRATRRQLYYWRDSETLYRRIVHYAPGYYLAHYGLGTALRERGDAAGALGELQIAAGLMPSHAETHDQLGVCLTQLGRAAEAIAHHEQALNLSPDWAVGWSNFGVTLAALGRGAEAERCYRRAMALDPRYVPARNNLAVLLSEQGRHDEAIVEYEALLRIDPDYVRAYHHLGQCLAEAGRLEEAVRQEREAVRRQPEYPAARDALATQLRRLGRLDEAVAFSEIAVKQAPESAGFGNNLATLYAMRGQADRGIEVLTRVLRGRPDYAEGHYNRALMYWELGRAMDAEAGFREAIQLRPDYRDARWQLANLLQENGRSNEAAAELQAMLGRWPEEEQRAREKLDELHKPPTTNSAAREDE